MRLGMMQRCFEYISKRHADYPLQVHFLRFLGIYVCAGYVLLMLLEVRL